MKKTWIWLVVEAQEYWGKNDPLFYSNDSSAQAAYLKEHGWVYKLEFFDIRYRWYDPISGGACDTTKQAYQNQKYWEYRDLLKEKEK